LIADLWSLSLLLSELMSLYGAETTGKPHSSPVGPSFFDHVRHERDFVASKRGTQQLAYWLDTLAEQTDRLKLPPWRDLAPPANLTGHSVHLPIDQSLSEKLRRLSAALGTTLAVTLFTAYQILLWRFSGQASFRLALVSGGRSDSRFATTVGYFVNLLVVRVAPAPDATFAEMIGMVQESVTTALKQGAYPYGLLVKELQRGSAARQDLFDAVFVMQSSPHELSAAKFAVAAGAPVTISGLELTPLPIETGTSQFDLSLAAAEVDDQIALELRYNTNIFPADFAASMLDCLGSLLEQLVTEPQSRAGAARLLRASSVASKAANFEPSANFESDETLVSLFERQV
jgi:non-ribosomal peptide synthetase component F